MNADLIRRIAELEKAVGRSNRPPLRLVDVTKFDGLDRDAYWQEDTTVMTRFGVPADSPS